MTHPHGPLSAAHIERFVNEGFVRIDEAFPSELAAACREKLWLATGLAPDAPSTWTAPVIRIGEISHPLFREAASTPALVAAYDALVGPGRWLPARPGRGRSCRAHRRSNRSPAPRRAR